MLVVTGGAGFIGSALIWELNELGHNDIVVVDSLGVHDDKWKNLRKRSFLDVISIDAFPNWLSQNYQPVEAVFHMGACSSTTERNMDYLWENNFRYSVRLFEICASKRLPFIYASSAATYGEGELGFSDDPDVLPKLRPVNPYGFSKQVFDRWVVQQAKAPIFWTGLKFFNVFGPQEYHKGAQASVVCKTFPQVKNDGTMALFKSYRSDVRDGEQKRDFIYVKDVTKVMVHLLKESSAVKPGIYNVGTGQARTFADLGRALFGALGDKPAKFQWIDMPDNIRSQYQYLTEATLANLRDKAQYREEFFSLEAGVADYVQNYLSTNDPYL